MQTILLKKASIFMLLISFVCSTFPATSYAGLVGSDQVLADDSRSRQLTGVRNLLARDDVKAQMLDLGVDPASVDERLDALTDAELARLSAGMQELPAGGSVVAVIGLVFIVLLILELVGAINIFNKI
ncbi:MAG: PA2779 family protein [Gammaproteobacteria bacterium]|jgi:hypothetical protein